MNGSLCETIYTADIGGSSKYSVWILKTEAGVSCEQELDMGPAYVSDMMCILNIIQRCFATVIAHVLISVEGTMLTCN